MPLVAAICTQCGAELQIDNSHDAAICKFCNTPFIVEKAIAQYNTHIIQNFAGANVTIVGHDFESIKTRATLFLEEGNFTKAIEYAEKALDIKPDDAELYFIRLLARHSSKNLTELRNKTVDIASDTDYDRVIRFGNENLIKVLKETVEYINIKREKEIYLCGLLTEKEHLVKQQNAIEIEKENFKHKYGGSKFLKVFCYISTPIMVVLGLLCCIVLPPLGLFCVIFGISLPFYSKRYEKKAKLVKEDIDSRAEKLDTKINSIDEILQRNGMN